MIVVARVVVAEYRGCQEKSGTLDDGKRWAHLRVNMEDETGSAFFIKVAEVDMAAYRRPAKGEVVAYLVDQYDRVQSELPDASALADYLGVKIAA